MKPTDDSETLGGEEGGEEESGPDLSKLDSKQLDGLDDKMYEKEQKAGDRGVNLNKHLDSLMDTRHSGFRTDPEGQKENIIKKAHFIASSANA